MANEPVYGWDERSYIISEGTFGTAVIPTAASAIEVITLDMGPAEVQNTRAKKDKTQGRDMTLAFVSGRVDPIPFILKTSVKSRSAADTTPKESLLYKSAGFTETTNSSTSVVYTMSSAPTIQGVSIVRGAGTGTGSYLAEHGRGGLVESLKFHGGDEELTVEAAGKFVGKASFGQASGTLSSDVDTTLALDTAAHGYRFAPNGGTFWGQIESEVVKCTAVDYSSGVLTVARGEASTSAAAHSSQIIYPYLPTPTYSGSPISEANCTVTLDSVATKCTKFDIEITTGIGHLPGETGSKYAQGGRAIRMDVKVALELVLTKELVDLIGKANQRKTCTLTIVCGTGTGSIVTFSMPYTEIEAFPTPFPENDITIVSPTLRIRGNSGNDMFSFTLT